MEKTATRPTDSPSATAHRASPLAADIRGYSKLAVDATLGVTGMVENLHSNITRSTGPLGTPTLKPARGVSGFVYRSIRGVTRLVGGSIDVVLAQVAPLLALQSSSDTREAIVAAMNGVLGDHLVATGNPLAIGMRFRRNGEALTLTRETLAAAIPTPSSRVVILIHGLCMNDLQWMRDGHDHGASLSTDAAFTPPVTTLYLHYNTGRHISVNGRELSEQITALMAAWPVPITQLDLVCHSMGGLVARSACHYAAQEETAWLKSVHKIIFLGSPHEGAPLERGGNYVNLLLDASPYTTAFARLAKIRSAGITDLRHGTLLDENWHDKDRFASARKNSPAPAVPLPMGVECYAIAATTTSKEDAAKRAVDGLNGYGLVPVASALGHSNKPGHQLGIPKSRQWIAHGVNHMDLLGNKRVYRKLRNWLVQD